ncbi:MAG: hypothetical protein ACLFTI_03060 [Anaerolineales bacterium]
MQHKVKLLISLLFLSCLLVVMTSVTAPPALAADPSPPTSPVKLIFIHHSCGGHWLADTSEIEYPAGGLGQALMDNNYFVSATNYGWGPDGIGDRTDIPNWPEWFTGPNREEIMTAVYTETGQNIGGFGDWTRMATDPGGPNQIIMFKSCYPNSDLYGKPDDPPHSEPNDWEYSVSNAKAVYNHILTYFEAHQEKLFIVITAPPMTEVSYIANDHSTPAAERAANARAFNDWLVNDWLAGYAPNNVAVFDFYNVLTSNGSASRMDDTSTNEEPHDYEMRPDGNHHYWDGSAIMHTQTISNNFAAYPYYSDPLTVTDPWADDHPTATGNQKATAEFVDLLNVFYNRWQGGEPPDCVGLTDVGIDGPTRGYTGTSTTFTARITPTNASTPITYTWTPTPDSGQGSASVTYTWAVTGTQIITLTAVNCDGSDMVTHTITLTVPSMDIFPIYLPLILKGWSASPTPTPTDTPGPTETPPPASGDLVQPSDFTYLGAFRLPGDDMKPKTFAYGGNAMTFNPDGDGGNGSLFIMGHDRQPWGDLPDGGQVAEISIPAPVDSHTLGALNTGTFIQNFANVADGYFTDLEELPRTGMAYLNHPDTGPLIHLSWGQHHKPDVSQPSYAWFSTTLTAPNLQGLWYIGDQDWYSLNGYMFEIPATWADTHAGGRYLGTGRQMDGGWGGMGPSLFAYRPWQIDGTPEISGTHLMEVPLLLYDDTQINGDVVQGANTLAGHQHPDEWEGGAWITTPSGNAAVLFAGNQGTGAKYWYGYRNPDGPEYPCVNTQAASEFTACRLADGSPCPASDMVECDGHTSAKGWWCAEFTPRFILYDPADLAQVAAGTMEPWEPQPYAHLDVGEHIFDNPAGVDLEMMGEGVQRRYLFGAAAYDRANGRLFVLELFADEAKPVVHVWQVE